MRVLGIDCGTERTGFGVIETNGVAHRMIASGVIQTRTSESLHLRLAVIASSLRALIHDHRPEAVAVEEVFHSVNTKSTLKLAHVRGVALLTAAEAGRRAGRVLADGSEDECGRIRPRGEESGAADGSVAAAAGKDCI